MVRHFFSLFASRTILIQSSLVSSIFRQNHLFYLPAEPPLALSYARSRHWLYLQSLRLLLRQPIV